MPLKVTLDILVQRMGEQGQGSFLFVQNNFFFDAFFLKAMVSLSLCRATVFTNETVLVLKGACNNGWCAGSNGSASYHVSAATLHCAYPLILVAAFRCELFGCILQVHHPRYRRSSFSGSRYAYRYKPGSKSVDQKVKVNISYGSGSCSGKEYMDTVVLRGNVTITNQCIGAAKTTRVSTFSCRFFLIGFEGEGL